MTLQKLSPLADRQVSLKWRDKDPTACLSRVKEVSGLIPFSVDITTVTVSFGLGTVDTPSLQERIQARDDPKEVYIHCCWNVFKPFDQIFFKKREMPYSLSRVGRAIETESTALATMPGRGERYCLVEGDV